MFPSSGYFRGIYCPFYVSGLCERPYCHFRHSRIEEKQPIKQDNSPSYSTNNRLYTPGSVQLNNLGQKDVASYSTLARNESTGLVEVYQTSSNKPVQEAKTSTCPIPSFSETPQSLPEPDELPVRLGSLPKISGLPRPRSKSSDTPSYTPTPKRVEVIAKGLVPSYSPTPKQTEKSYKKSSSHTAEYDPVKNFAVRENVSSDDDDDVPSDHEDVNSSVSKEISDILSLKDQAVVSDNCNSTSEKKLSSIAEDDLTDSDEDVSHDYSLKQNSELQLKNYAQLLAPSSFFTSKLNSPASTRLSTESNPESVKSNGIIQNKISTSNSISHHKSSKAKHHSRHSSQDVTSNPLHSLSKASSSTKDLKKISSKPSESSSESKTSSKSSVSRDKHQPSSDSHRKPSHASKDKNSALKHSSQMSSKPLIKQSGMNKSVTNSLEDKLEKCSSNPHLKLSAHKEKNDISLNCQSDKSSNSLEKRSHQDEDSKNVLKSNSGKCSPNSHRKHSHKDTNNKNSSLKVDSSSKSNKREGSSGVEKLNKQKSSNSSSSSSSSSKSRSHKTGSSSTSGKPVKRDDVKNGPSNHKKENKAETCDKPANHKRSGSNMTVSTSEIKVKSENCGGISPEKSSRRSSSDSGHRSDSHRRKSLSLLNAAVIKQEHKKSINKIRNSEKDMKRGNNGDNSTHLRRDSNEKNQGDKISVVRKSSVENGQVGRERRISDLTSNLFGEESGRSGSDSDVEIVDAPVEPPPLVFELSESENDMDNNSEEDESVSFSFDIDMTDTDTFDECLKIFKETERVMAAKLAKTGLGANPDTAKIHEAPTTEEAAESLLMSVSKKRMAHTAAGQVKKPVKAPSTARHKPSPAEVMHNRIVEMQKRALLHAAKREGRESELPLKLSDNKVSSSSRSTDLTGSVTESQTLSESANSFVFSQKKREAHIPGMKTTPTKTAPAGSNSATWSPNSFYTKTKAESSKSADPVASKKLVTISSTASKGEKRKAHELTQTNLKRPVIPIEFGDKVPTNVRQRYLNLIIDEYLKFNPEDTAFTKGQEEEQAVYNRASNKNIYLRVAVIAITRIRSEALESQPSSSKKPCPGLSSLTSMASTVPSQSHEATLGGSLAVKRSFTLNRSGLSSRNVPQTFSGKELYDHLTKYILTESQLQANGFPRPAEDGSSKAQFYKENDKDKMLKDNERTCRRCGKMFYVDKHGETITPESCVYHYANAYKKKVAGFIDSRYGCCNERIGSKGCQVAKCHVHERNKTDCLTGYMRTLPASESSPQNYSVFSLDCEMVYTTIGLELARVTVIGDDCSVKYETLVKPDADIIDYNTRFSGITEKDMLRVSTTLRGVQAVLLSMICDKTILMGHSLESDLQALKLIHSTVVDTSIVFPHRLGLPYKRALRSLMVDHLQKIIQADDGGHDSKEDAVACMQLMLYKVKSDVRRKF